MIKQADENDILTIEGILIDAVIWMKKINYRINGMRTV